MGGLRAISLAAVDVLEGAARELHRKNAQRGGPSAEEEALHRLGLGEAATDAPTLSTLRLCLGAGVAIGLLDVASTALPPGLATLGWVGAASLLFAGGFVLHSTLYRFAAFGVLAISVVRVPRYSDSSSLRE